MTKEEFNKLFGKMSFEFLNLIKHNDPAKFEKLVMDEIFSDQLILSRDPAKTKVQVFPYITKYNFLILHLENMQEFERCATIKKTLLVFLINQFNIKEELILSYLESSMIDLKKQL